MKDGYSQRQMFSLGWRDGSTLFWLLWATLWISISLTLGLASPEIGLHIKYMLYFIIPAGNFSCGKFRERQRDRVLMCQNAQFTGSILSELETSTVVNPLLKKVSNLDPLYALNNYRTIPNPQFVSIILEKTVCLLPTPRPYRSAQPSQRSPNRLSHWTHRDFFVEHSE